MHVPLTKQKDELLLGEIGINQCDGNAMKGEIPGGVPWVFPLVRHGNDVFVVELRPILVAALLPPLGRFGPGGKASRPRPNVLMKERLGPYNPGKVLANAGLGCSGAGFWDRELVEV